MLEELGGGLFASPISVDASQGDPEATGNATDVAVQGKVMGADGTASPSERLSKVQRTSTGIQGLDKLVATFDPAGLNAGNYVLQVAVTDPKTGRRQASSLPFQVIH